MEFNEGEKTIVKALGQSNLALRCIVIALSRQPGFDREAFIRDLIVQEQAIAGGRIGSDVLRKIVAQLEGYS